MKPIDFIKTHGYEVAAGCLIACFGGLMSALCLWKYHQFGYSDFDLAVHAQSLTNILQGSMDSSILGVPFLGNHMVLILFLFAPLCLLFPPAPTLLVIQALTLGMGGWAIFRLAKRELNRPFALGFTAIYLVYPPLLFMNLYEFHPIVLASTFLLFACDAFRGNRLGAFLAWSILAMLCQENVSLIIFCFGLLACVERRRPAWAIIPMATGIVYFVTVVGIVMPHLNQSIQFVAIYGRFGDTLPEVAINILRHPLVAISAMLEPAKLVFLNMLVSPTAYLSLLSPTSLIPLLLVLPQRLLSERQTETLLIFHYQAEFIPFVFMSAISGARNVLAWSQKWRILRPTLAIALVTMTLLTVALSNLVPRLLQDMRTCPWRTPEIHSRVTERLESVGSRDSVLATFEFLPKLSSHQDLCSLHHLYVGRYTLSSIPFPVPAPIDCVLLNTLDRLTFHSSGFYDPHGAARLREILSVAQWDVVENIDSFVMLRRSHQPGTYPDALIRFVDSASPAFTNITFHTNGLVGIELIGLDFGQLLPDGSTPLTLYWKRTSAQTVKEFDILLGLKSGDQTHVTGLTPGSRLYPPQDWPDGRLVEDRHHILLPGTFNATLTEAEVLALPMTR